MISSFNFESRSPSSQTMVMNSHPKFLKPYLKPSASFGIFIFCIISRSQEREWTSQPLKITHVKLSQELHLDWVKFLPLLFFRLRTFSKQSHFISLFEIMCGQLVLTPGLLPRPSLLPDHHSPLAPLVCHLCSLIWNFTDQHLSWSHTNSLLSVPYQPWRSGPSFPSLPSWPHL